MSGERIVQVVEIDVPQCTREFGVGACGATLGAAAAYKCFNTFPTCTYKQAFNRGTVTLKFIEPSYSVKGGNYIPALRSVSGREQEVNIAGFSDRAVGLGVRASVNVSLADFTDRDTLTDKYWAERMSGTAQLSGIGYDPMDRGSFWTKFKARNPNYSGFPLRVIQAHYNAAGALVYDVIRSYVISDIDGPSGSGSVTIKAKDILSLADDKKALAPFTSIGRVGVDFNETADNFTLSPAGVGASYPASGRITIGSEIMTFARVGDVMTLTGRGLQGTEAASHSINDTVQVAYHVDRVRADVVIRDLLMTYGNIPAGYIDVAEWSSEFDRWGASMVLSATICKPTGVAKLISEINQLGVTVWWDEVAQKIRVKLNHPPEENPVEISDRNNIISIKQEDNEDERATRVSLWSVQIDPTKDLSAGNFMRNYITIYVDGEHEEYHDESRTHTITTRWLNHGADAAAKIITGRLLIRYQNAPIIYTVVLDAKDDIKLTDVVALNSHVATDPTGNSDTRLTQVFYRSDTKAGSQITVKLQRFLFNARYGVITENSRPDYNSSTQAQKDKGTYLVGPTLLFADGTGAYRFV